MIILRLRSVPLQEKILIQITKYAFMVNDFLKKFFDDCGIDLSDFKIEFGKTSDGTITLADEISPDTCRFGTRRRMKSKIRIVSEEILAA